MGKEKRRDTSSGSSPSDSDDRGSMGETTSSASTPSTSNDSYSESPSSSHSSDRGRSPSSDSAPVRNDRQEKQRSPRSASRRRSRHEDSDELSPHDVLTQIAHLRGRVSNEHAWLIDVLHDCEAKVLKTMLKQHERSKRPRKSRSRSKDRNREERQARKKQRKKDKCSSQTKHHTPTGSPVPVSTGPPQTTPPQPVHPAAEQQQQQVHAGQAHAIIDTQQAAPSAANAAAATTMSHLLMDEQRAGPSGAVLQPVTQSMATHRNQHPQMIQPDDMMDTMTQREPPQQAAAQDPAPDTTMTTAGAATAAAAGDAAPKRRTRHKTVKWLKWSDEHEAAVLAEIEQKEKIGKRPDYKKLYKKLGRVYSVKQIQDKATRIRGERRRVSAPGHNSSVPSSSAGHQQQQTQQQTQQDQVQGGAVQPAAPPHVNHHPSPVEGQTKDREVAAGPLQQANIPEPGASPVVDSQQQQPTVTHTTATQTQPLMYTTDHTHAGSQAVHDTQLRPAPVTALQAAVVIKQEPGLGHAQLATVGHPQSPDTAQQPALANAARHDAETVATSTGAQGQQQQHVLPVPKLRPVNTNAETADIKSVAATTKTNGNPGDNGNKKPKQRDGSNGQGKASNKKNSGVSSKSKANGGSAAAPDEHAGQEADSPFKNTRSGKQGTGLAAQDQQPPTPLRQKIQEVLIQAPGCKGTVIDVVEELMCDRALAALDPAILQRQVASILAANPEFVSTRAYQSLENKRVQYILDPARAETAVFKGRKPRPLL